MDLDVRCKTIKLLGKKIIEKSSVPWARQQALGLHYKSTVVKGEQYTGLHQNEKLLLCKKLKRRKSLRNYLQTVCLINLD